MTQYIRQPGQIHIAPDFKGLALDAVPAGYYNISFCDKRGFYLSEVDALQVPDKVYGNLLEHLPRIEAAFNESVSKPLSVMLEGLKGSGKSLLMKTLANRFVKNEDGIVLLCNFPYTGDDFFQFLQKISQKKIVLMDEFDKVYKEKDQRNNILTLLDGNFASHTMFIITMNSGLSSGNFEFFHNRPGRVMFNIKFKGVPEDVIRAYSEDHLNDQSRVAEVMQFVKRFTDFNMDMLCKLINEINFVPTKSIEELAEYLNVKPDLTLDDITFLAKYTRNGIDVTKHIHGDVNDRDNKQFIRSLRGGEDYHLNLMLRGSVINTTQGRAYDSVKDKDSDDEVKRGQLLQVGRNNKVFVQSFDEYLYPADTTRTQNPETGVITLSVTTADAEKSKWTIELTPQVRKRYTYSF